ncbi:MAG: cytidine deaminase [Bacteroidetes bacterium]|nr:cytidine deaminase [Bacteroidota bacterium]
MKELSLDISSNSYTPYSKKPESCLILGSSGVVYPGVRVENISFPLTIPAVQAGVCSCLGNADNPVGVIGSKSNNDNLLEFWAQTFQLKTLDRLPDETILYDPLIDGINDVTKRLKKLCKKSVSDRSGFPVSALLETENGYIPGVNIEFEQWNLGLCAERVAIVRAIAAGFNEFKSIHIYAPKSEFISPCGACRQVLYEFMPDGLVELHHDDESKSKHFVSDLLPNGFTTNSLKK